MNNNTMAPDSEGGAWVPWMAGVLVLAAIGALVFWAMTSFKGHSGGHKTQMVKIAVLPDTPPPPPKEEKKPELEKHEDKPQPQQEQLKPQVAPPEPQQLKMDGPTGDAPSNFSGGPITQEYKGGDVGTGQGGNGLQFALFTSQVQRHIQSSLARNNRIKLGDYRVDIRVWLTPAGEMRVELALPSGDDKTDEALKQAFTQLPPMAGTPAFLPQPIRLRITNRMTG
jgi:protein TonB